MGIVAIISALSAFLSAIFAGMAYRENKRTAEASDKFKGNTIEIWENISNTLKSQLAKKDQEIDELKKSNESWGLFLVIAKKLLDIALKRYPEIKAKIERPEITPEAKLQLGREASILIVQSSAQNPEIFQQLYGSPAQKDNINRFSLKYIGKPIEESLPIFSGLTASGIPFAPYIPFSNLIVTPAGTQLNYSGQSSEQPDDIIVNLIKPDDK